MEEIAARTNEDYRTVLLSRRDIAGKYVNIADIPAVPPPPGRTPLYPYKEWARIPPGKAVEITLLLRGRKPYCVKRALARYIRRHQLGLRIMERVTAGQSRMWVTKPPREEGTSA
jgi:hypothetical protein